MGFLVLALCGPAGPSSFAGRALANAIEFKGKDSLINKSRKKIRILVTLASFAGTTAAASVSVVDMNSRSGILAHWEIVHRATILHLMSTGWMEIFFNRKTAE